MLLRGSMAGEHRRGQALPQHSAATPRHRRATLGTEPLTPDELANRTEYLRDKVARMLEEDDFGLYHTVARGVIPAARPA